MKNTALLIIDAQKIYSNEDSELVIEGMNTYIKKINKLIDFFEKNKSTVIYIKHQHTKDGNDAGRLYDFSGEEEELGFVEGTEEVEYTSELKIIDNKYEIIKTRYNAFYNTNLNEILEQNNISKIVISGFMTNFCCDSTARSAHDRDYFIDYMYDATGCPDLENFNQEKIKKIYTETLSFGFANILNVDDFIKDN